MPTGHQVMQRPQPTQPDSPNWSCHQASLWVIHWRYLEPTCGRVLPPCKVSWQSEQRLRFAIKDVRNGQLRDMCAQVGLEVVSIRRLRIGRISLGKGPNGAMPPGQWRYLPVGEKF